jgi:hypothetical protein
VLDKLTQSAAQVRFAKRDDAAQTLLANAPHPAFRVVIEIRASGLKPDGLYTRRPQDGDELTGEHGVAIVNQKARAAEKASPTSVRLRAFCAIHASDS